MLGRQGGQPGSPSIDRGRAHGSLAAQLVAADDGRLKALSLTSGSNAAVFIVVRAGPAGHCNAARGYTCVPVHGA